MILRGCTPLGQIERRPVGGNLGTERPELAEIDPGGCEPPVILVLYQLQIVAGLHAQGLERGCRKRGLPLGGDFDAEPRRHAGKSVHLTRMSNR